MEINTFKRYEQKYLLSESQYEYIMLSIGEHMKPDEHGFYPISNLYYDTDNFELIRSSIEKPAYKEKLRMRCYGQSTDGSTVFFELKKKFNGVVYKRRASLPYNKAIAFAQSGICPDKNDQIQYEIAAFLAHKPVQPRVFIYYERKAFVDEHNPSLRITFDSNLRFRQHKLTLADAPEGTEILPDGQALMEIKASSAFPLWLCKILSQSKAYPTSFSKYGTCYKKFIIPQQYKTQEVISCQLSLAKASSAIS